MKKLLFLLMLILANDGQSFTSGVLPLPAEPNKVSTLYHDCGLENRISLAAFDNSLAGYEKFAPSKPIIAICDFTKPSNEERFFIIDIEQKKYYISRL